MAAEDHDERIERRRRVVALIRAMNAKDDGEVERIIGELVADSDRRRVIGALGVAASTLLSSVAAVTNRPAEDVLSELEKGLTEAPTD